MQSSTAELVPPAPPRGSALPSPRWPLPPFHRTTGERAPDIGRPLTCIVERTGLPDCRGTLTGFDTARGVIEIRDPERGESLRLGASEFRLLRLAEPMLLARDADAIARHPATFARWPDDPTVALLLRDGTRVGGRSRGVVRVPSGIFLYLVQGPGAETLACFVPLRSVLDLSLGAHPEAKGTAAADDDRGNGAITTQADLAHALSHPGIASRRRIGDILLEDGVITREQLNEALAVKQADPARRLGDILVGMGAATPAHIRKALSRKLGVPYVDARNFPIDPTLPPLLPKGLAVRLQALPLMRLGDHLVVAVEDPMLHEPLRDVEFITGSSAQVVIADPDALRERIAHEYATIPDRIRGAGDLATPVAAEALASQLADQSPAQRADEPEEGAVVSENVLVRLVNKIVADAHAKGASDIHIETNPGTEATKVRLRRDGDLEDYLELPPAFRGALVSRIKIMAGLDIAEHRRGQDGKINFARHGVPVELRVAIVPTGGGLEDVVMRLLASMEPLPLEKLGLLDRDRELLEKMSNRSYGLILVCGPTGSGKTTTLHSVLRRINRPDLKIWTAEDPVEITQKGLRQVQVNARIGWSFADAMRSFLRADPDVIMIGEMRDAETAKIGIEASLTGHLVLSTLHTNSAAESITRLLELGMDPYNFADALIGILAQRLARRLCPHCRKVHLLGEDELLALATEYCEGTKDDPVSVMTRWRHDHGSKEGLKVYEPVGCPKCTQGYKGRVGIYELLSTTPRVKSLVAARASVAELVEAAQEGGMRLLKQDAIEKVFAGLLDVASARAASS